jgi:hypothetical protein
MSMLDATRGFFGAWKLNREKSVYQLGEPPKIGDYLIEPEGEKLKVTMHWVTVDDKEFNQVYYSIPDGVEYPYTDGPGVDAVSMTLTAPNTLDSAAIKDGKVINFARRILSDDGKTLKITMSGITPQGTEYSNLAIYEK